MNNICLSGGAAGADRAWGQAAAARGDQIINFTFAGHSTAAPRETLCELNEHQLAKAEPFLEVANQTLQRVWPPESNYVKNLLRRNWYQVCRSKSCYAVSRIIDQKIDGGTAWAVQMFIDRHQNEPCNVWVFDQYVGRWYKWERSWVIIKGRPPTPRGVYTGIGNRSLLDYARDEIKILFKE